MRGFSIAAIVAVGLAACMANDGGAADIGSSDVLLEEGPNLGTPRATHRLVAAGKGQLLAIGGCVRSGCDAGPESATVDIIDASSMKLAGTGTLLARRIGPEAVTLSDGRVLIIGGWIDGRPSATTEIFDPAMRRSVAGPALSAPRANPVAVAMADGRILIAGGYDGRDTRADAEIFDPGTGRFLPTGALTGARSGATGTLLADGRILIVGGGRAERRPRIALASADIFDPATGRFISAGSMEQRRYKHGAVRLDNGDVLIIGGSDERDYGGKLTSVERFDSASGRFAPAGNLADARFKLGDTLLVLPGNRILVAAGGTAPEIFDVARGQGARLDYDLGGDWNYMMLARVDDRTALLAGGYREGEIEPTDRSWIVRLPKV
ncbi:MAG: hypothetical protein U0S50_16815 [Sphingopyxis sp.]|uniref:Kelch repeat-containing protein n=1 Tax=Sphingopyxis sp. TaxID=1908224 RepID=UPI002AB87295|nr:hypothetical protein [Sphingopyxis sp.]MDZ3833457.1 hypothetical protein [Sphingopyxis sp.]